MTTEDKVIEMIDSVIKKIEEVIADSSKQSFGSLEYFLPTVIETRDKKLFLNKNWFFRTPRWLGEYGNTSEEEEVYSELIKITMFVAEEFHGGWSN